MRKSRLLLVALFGFVLIVSFAVTEPAYAGSGCCSGDLCGCQYEEAACIAACPDDPNDPLVNYYCTRDCMRASIQCGIACCSPYASFNGEDVDLDDFENVFGFPPGAADEDSAAAADAALVTGAD